MKKCIIVLGMHRSGTSAIMGVLKALSVEMGSNMMVPSPHNPKGYFELLDIVNLNDRILSHFHSLWDSPFALPENWWKGSDLNGYRKEITETIRTNFEDADMISIKDPRLCRLLPLWSEIFEGLGIKTYFLIPLRNPLEIALSLKTRDEICLEKSLLLWMTHMIEAELYSRKYPRVFITYDGLLKDPSSTINDIQTALKIKFPRSYQDVKDEVARFLDLGLKHHNQGTPTMDKVLSEEVFSYYRLLSNLAGKEAASKDELADIDNIRDRYFGLNRLFYNKDLMMEKEFTRESIIAEKERIIAEKEHNIAEKELTIAKQERAIAYYESRLIYIPSLKNLERNFRRKVVYPLRDLFSSKEKSRKEITRDKNGR